ncbi:uncharacterized protein IWZ02DRAFT_201694 [Phyllosticta citriasiana]|uniref:uncharacterized protein n=1 Tax=Phyllosticta citriasiana TaxID=595635 RepID=UPI0030FD34D2
MARTKNVRNLLKRAKRKETKIAPPAYNKPETKKNDVRRDYEFEDGDDQMWHAQWCLDSWNKPGSKTLLLFQWKCQDEPTWEPFEGHNEDSCLAADFFVSRRANLKPPSTPEVISPNPSHSTGFPTALALQVGSRRSAGRSQRRARRSSGSRPRRQLARIGRSCGSPRPWRRSSESWSRSPEARRQSPDARHRSEEDSGRLILAPVPMLRSKLMEQRRSRSTILLERAPRTARCWILRKACHSLSLSRNGPGARQEGGNHERHDVASNDIG